MTTANTLLRYITEDLLASHGDLDLEGDDNILTTGLIDSLGIMQLIGFIEEEFGVVVPPEDVTIEHFRTVNKIIAYLDMHRTPVAGD